MKDMLVIKIDGGLGRVIAMSGAITEVARKRPVKVITSRPLVFRGNQLIRSVHGLDDRRLYEDMLKDKYGYSGDVSMNDFVEGRFGKDARVLIHKML